MPIVQQGSINTTALVVPDLYVQIVPPQNLVLNGVPTNVVGVVGSASWGPVDQPVLVATMSDYAINFGPVVARKFDMGTHVATAVQQGASNFRCVRVTDGTDTAANYALFYASGAYPVLLTARYSGSTGNAVTITLAAGTQKASWRLTLALAGQTPEVFDNIAAPSPAAFWANLVNAVNLGGNPLRGPSQIVVASLGTATTTAPVALSGQTLAGGTDGASAVSATSLIGQDVLPRQGVLRAARSGLLGSPAGRQRRQHDVVDAGGVRAVRGGLHDPDRTVRRHHPERGHDQVDGGSRQLRRQADVRRLDLLERRHQRESPGWSRRRASSPGGSATSRPSRAHFNKPLYSVIGSQRSGAPGSAQVTTYSDAELQLLFGAGIDVISNPQPGGAYWGVRCGHNSSSNAATNGDNYTRLTNFIASTLAAGMGQFVGQVINASLFQNIRSTQLSYLQGLFSQGSWAAATARRRSA